MQGRHRNARSVWGAWTLLLLLNRPAPFAIAAASWEIVQSPKSTQELLHFGMIASFDKQKAIGAVLKNQSSLREIIFRSHRIFYDVSEESRRVDILHVWHGAREVPSF
jgi:plasmid stabilization system protein ParE